MKEFGVEERVRNLELNLTEGEIMTCQIIDKLLNEDIIDEILGVIDTAYEAGQDAIAEIFKENCEVYIAQEQLKENLVKTGLLYLEDPYYEREFRRASSKQELIREMMKGALGESVDFCRIGEKVYLEIGRIDRV